MKTRLLGTSVLLSAMMMATPAAAQRARPVPGERGVPRAEREPATKLALERRVRQEFYRAARTRIGLNDDQMRRLAAVNAKYETQRRALNREERETRQQLRASMQSKSSQDQTK